MALHGVAQVSAVSKDEQAAIERLAASVYEGISSDLGPCHVSDFYDAFYNQVVPSSGGGWAVRPTPALESAVERVRRLDPAIERIVIGYMRRNYADRKGML